MVVAKVASLSFGAGVVVGVVAELSLSNSFPEVLEAVGIGTVSVAGGSGDISVDAVVAKGVGTVSAAGRVSVAGGGSGTVLSFVNSEEAVVGCWVSM